MNWERIEGNWTQLKGKVVEKWGKLSDDDLDVVAGRREQLAGKVQERYGVAKEEAPPAARCKPRGEARHLAQARGRAGWASADIGRRPGLTPIGLAVRQPGWYFFRWRCQFGATKEVGAADECSPPTPSALPAPSARCAS